MGVPDIAVAGAIGVLLGLMLALAAAMAMGFSPAIDGRPAFARLRRPTRRGLAGTDSLAATDGLAGTERRGGGPTDPSPGRHRGSVPERRSARVDPGRRSSRDRRTATALVAEAGLLPDASVDTAPSSLQIIDALPVAVAVVDSDEDVVLANQAADQLGILAGNRVALPELRLLVQDTRRAGQPHEAEVTLAASRLRRAPEAVRVRLAPVGDCGQVAMLIEDVTEARRVEAVRRDFVANVSHELKTPVGAMAVLAEALVDASEDPSAVRRFAGRVQTEASRLGRLVQELIDLSRLQGADPLPEPAPVRVDRVVAEALDRTRTVAAARGIELMRGGEHGLVVLGSELQLITALSNLLDNAVHYSPERTRVALAVRSRAGTVELIVTDQGIGIAERDLERVFERFYRADPARSRATGGTGLGLAIVKHVATNHGGEVKVWSVLGAGSTFTLRLPEAPPADYASLAVVKESV